MDKLESLEELFAGRHFDREVIILCVRWYLRFKLSLRELGLTIRCLLLLRPLGDDGRAWSVAGTYDHYAMGPVLHTGVREALAPICPCPRSVVAC